MKKQLISTFLSLCLVLSLGAPALAFSDTDGHWGQSSIDRWSDYKVVEGDNGAFDPSGNLTVGQFATILCRLLGLTEKSPNTFPDLKDDAWYTPYILACVQAGILKGNGVGINPESPVTREQSFVMAGRALKIAPIDAAGLEKFTDGKNISDWAAGYMSAMIKMGIISGMGDGTVAPLSSIDRASMVAILDKSITTYINTPGEHKITGSGIAVINTKGAVTLTGEARGSIIAAPGSNGSTLDLKGVSINGPLVIEGNDVKIINAPAGTTVVAGNGVSGTTVNGGAVNSGNTTVVEGGGSTGGGGYVPPTTQAVDGIVGVRPVDHSTTPQALDVNITTSANKTLATGIITINLSSDKVVPIHKNAAATLGRWVGLAITAPVGVSSFNYTFGTSPSETASTATTVTADPAIGTGNYAVFFVNAGALTPKTHITIDWDGADAVYAPQQYVVDLSGVGTAVNDAAELQTAINAGGAVELGSDIAISSSVTIATKVTLDLAGHTITLTTPADDANSISAFLISPLGDLTLKNTTGDGKITVNAIAGPGYSTKPLVECFGKFTMESGTIETNENVYYALTVYGTSCDATINGGTIKSSWKNGAEGVAISGHGKSSNQGFKLTITDGSITGGEQALYLPSAGETLIAGGTITGSKEGIEIRAGDLTISGGEISATAARVTNVTTNSGATGAYTGALVIAKSKNTSATGYNGHINVTLSGGKLINDIANGDALCLVHEAHPSYTEPQNVVVTIGSGVTLTGGENIQTGFGTVTGDSLTRPTN